jgi:hypothetical protein
LLTTIQTARIDAKITRLQIYALIIAALAHDAGHTGFREIEQSQIAYTVLYRHHACIEIRHCKILMQVLARDECNILSGLEPPAFREIWQLIVDLIHATNFGMHFTLMKEYDSVVKDSPLNLDKPKHCLIVLKLLMKLADLSDLAKEDFEPVDGFFDEIFAEGELSPLLGFVFQKLGESDIIAPLIVDREKSKDPALSTTLFSTF